MNAREALMENKIALVGFGVPSNILPRYRDEIISALTPKTSDEICKALDSFLKERDVEMLSDVQYNGLAFWFYDGDDYATEICQYDEMENSLTFWYRNNLTPEHISAIGAFFENKRKESL